MENRKMYTSRHKANIIRMQLTFPTESDQKKCEKVLKKMLRYIRAYTGARIDYEYDLSIRESANQ